MRKKFILFVLCLLALPCALLFTGCTNAKFKLDFIVDNAVYYSIDTSGEETITLPTNPTKDDFIFDGWFWDNNEWQRPFTANSLLNEPLSSDMKVYAKWINDNSPKNTQANFLGFTKENEDTYSISLSNNTEVLNMSNVVEIDSRSTWKLTTDIQANKSIASKIATLNVGDNTYYVLVTAQNEDVKLYTIKIRRKPIYTVSFNGYAETQYIEEGSCVDKPNEPSREGYNFINWDYDFSTLVFSNLTINSNWIICNYTITYNLNSGSFNSEVKNIYNVETEDYVLIKPNRRGYLFKGWFDDENFSTNEIIIIPKGSTGNKVLFAKWEIVNYSIIYSLNNGINNENNPTTYNVNSDNIILLNPEKKGFTFNRWKGLNNETITTIPSGSIGNLYLTAVWDINTYNITYYLNDGICDSNPTTYNILTTTIILNQPVKIGYEFLGWYNNSDFDGDLIETIKQGSVGDLNLYAKWKKLIHKIIYNVNEGIMPIEYITEYTIDDIDFNLPIPTRKGYAFGGWYENESFNGNSVDIITINNFGIKNLYAKWTVVQYKIEYELNGGECSKLKTKYTINDSFIFASPTYNGANFIGWYLNSDFTGEKIDSISKGNTGELKLYAKWEFIEYSIKYVLNGGTLSDNVKNTFTINDSNFSIEKPTRNGYKFLGWYEDSRVCDKKISTINTKSYKNYTLYAKWIDSTHIGITTVEEFCKIGSQDSNNIYELLNDLDFNNKSWNSISNFVSTLQGNNYYLKNINKNLFEELNNCEINNLQIESKDITKSDSAYHSFYFGILAKTVNNSLLSNISVTGKLNITNRYYDLYCGGLIGYSSNSVFTNCSSNITIICSSSNSNGDSFAMVGGIIGETLNTDLISCSSNYVFDITSNYIDVGGITGHNSGGSHSNCTSKGSLKTSGSVTKNEI